MACGVFLIGCEVEMAMSYQVMIDVETLGTRPGCVILSIGAVRFNDFGIENRFYCNVSREDSLALGFTVDPKTVAWWAEQDEAVRARLAEHPVPVAVALARLSAFMTDDRGQVRRDMQVWCQGGSFDFPILQAAYERLSLVAPWHFWQERDSRTLFQVLKRGTSFEPKKLASGAHDALADATHQAQEVMRATGFIRQLRVL